MSTIKNRMNNVIEKQPDDATFEDILRELAFDQMINRGLKDSRANETISNQEMRDRICEWQNKN